MTLAVIQDGRETFVKRASFLRSQSSKAYFTCKHIVNSVNNKPFNMQRTIDQNYTKERVGHIMRTFIQFILLTKQIFLHFLHCFKVTHLNGFTSVRVTYFYIVINKRFNKLSLSLTHVGFDFYSFM